jgi:hypothetical protein
MALVTHDRERMIVLWQEDRRESVIRGRYMTEMRSG